MRWITLMLFTIFCLPVAHAQNFTREEQRLLAFIDVGTLDVTNPTERITLLDNNDQTVGYAWRMAPDNEQVLNLEHAILAPGFQVEFGEGEEAESGSVLSYLQLAKQLGMQGRRANSTAPANFSTRIINTQNPNGRRHVVWLIDYLDRQGSVQDNSLAIQSLLSNPRYLADVGGRNAVLYGYSMGGLIARHALLSIESRGETHNVGAYVSLDAPHRGAFIPPALEGYSRTLARMTSNVLVRGTIGLAIRSEIKSAVDLLDSPGARQLLGLYIGSGAPKTDKWTGGKTDGWRAYEDTYQALQGNNDLARHPSFYDLREELIDMGGYPTLPLNIGVSFGRANGSRLIGPGDRANLSADLRVELEPNTQILGAELESIVSPNHLCKVETLSLAPSRECPNLELRGQSLESIFVSSGSSAESFGRITEEISEAEFRPNALGLAAAPFVPPSLKLAGLGGVNTTAFVPATEEWLTFIPMVSAFDDKGWARDYPNNAPIGNLDTPFDVNIADNNNGTDPLDHEEITLDVIGQIEAQLINADIYQAQKIRIGTIGNGSSPTSSFWNAVGQFDVARYILPQNIRELPVVRSAAVTAAMTRNIDDKSKVAASIAASM